MKKSQGPQEVQLLQVAEDSWSFDSTAQIHPWLRGLYCASSNEAELDVGEQNSPLSPMRSKYRFGWQFVRALVLITLALVGPSTSLAANVAEPAGLQPTAALYDQRGDAFEQQQLLGNLSVVNFFFTSCPVACPTQMRKLSALYRKLPTVYDKPVNFVSFSVDPERDSQPILADYATKLQIDSESWRLITGAPEALKEIRKQYGSVVQKIKATGSSDGADIDHSLVVYLQDAQARVLMTYVGADVDAARIQRDILTLQRLKRDTPLR